MPLAGRCAIVVATAGAAALALSASGRLGPGAARAFACGPSHADTWQGENEVRGVARHGTIWALVPGRRLKPRRAVVQGPGSRPVEIVWRIGGRTGRRLSLSAFAPGEPTIGPIGKPVEHTGSEWPRPGDEWGSLWRFPSRGCWVFAVETGHVRGGLVVLYRRR